MTRVLNLMDPARLLPRRTLPLATLPTVMVLVAAATAAGGAWIGRDAERAAMQQQQAQADVERLKKVIGGSEQDRAAMIEALRQRALAEEQWVRRLEGRLDAAASGMAQPAAVGPADATPRAASAWVAALSGTATEGAWLTEVSIDSQGRVAATGRAVAAAPLHAHLARWREVPALSGAALNSIEVRRAEGDARELVFSIRPDAAGGAR